MPSETRPSCAGVETLPGRVGADVARRLQIALKTYLLFPAHHVNVQRTMADLQASLQAHFTEHRRPLLLDAEQADFLWRGARARSDPNAGDDRAFSAAANGVAHLVLHPGVGQHELMHLFDVFAATAGAGMADDDFVTLLWEKRCRHIEIAVLERADDHVIVPAIPLAKPVRLRPIGSLVAGSGTAALADLALEQQTLARGLATARLSRAETAALRARAAEEARAAPILHLVDVLLALAGEDGDFASFAGAMRLLRASLHRLVERRQLAPAAQLLDRLAEAAELPRFADAQHRAEIEAVVDSLGQGPPMAAVIKLLEEPHADVGDEVFAYLRALRPNAFEPLLDALLRGCHPEPLTGVVAELGGAAVATAFAADLRTADGARVARCLDLLVRMDRLRGVRAAAELLARPEPAVRRHAAQLLAAHGDQGDLAPILGLVTDPDAEVRRSVLEILARQPLREAFGPLWSLYGERAERHLDERDQELVLEAAARSDPELTAHVFPSELRRRAWLRSRREVLRREQRRIVRVLARVAHPRVQSVLRQLAGGPPGFVQNLCAAAIAAATRAEVDNRER